MIFHPHDLGTLAKAFSLLIEDMKLSKLASSVAASGKLLSKDMLALECVREYAKLLENLLQFPSESMLPLPISHIKQNTWAWDLLQRENKQTTIAGQKERSQNDSTLRRSSIVVLLEDQASGKFQVQNTGQVINESSAEGFPTQLDWDILSEMETLEDYDRLEREEVSWFSCFSSQSKLE